MKNSVYVKKNIAQMAAVLGIVAVISYFAGASPQDTYSQSTQTVIFLTTGTTWTVPSDWNSANNTIEVIGGGGSGRNNYQAGGSGGGGYSKITNASLSPGSIVGYEVGVGGTANAPGGDTFFCNSTSNCSSIVGSAVIVGAKGGAVGASLAPGLGGAAAQGVGEVKYSGGNGGDNVGGKAGAGGGGAAGPNGNGGAGGDASAASGGGGANGGSAGGGVEGGSSTVGDGGNNRFGIGGGIAPGGSGTNGGGGAGTGGNGSQEVMWTSTINGATAGPGGGGGGRTSGSGSAGAAYGGGGGSGSTSSVGGQGIIVITYTPVSVPGAPTSLNATAGSANIELAWAAPASDGGSPITNYEIYRSTNPTPTTLLTTIGNLTNYTDTTAVPGTTYYYRVRATNAFGDSGYSNEDNAAILSQCVSSPGGEPIRGYAWSDTIGWVDLHCENSGVCSTSDFGLSVAQDGSISGCAWSDNIGWVSASANDLIDCPSGACNARMEELALRGWMKALAANHVESGGWDGFISLNGSNYGPQLLSGVMSGYTWGDMNIGWLYFDAQMAWEPTCATQYVCTDGTHRQSQCVEAEVEACLPGLLCAAGACVLPPPPTTSFGGELMVEPRLIPVGGTVTVTWEVNDAESCEVTEDNPDIDDRWTEFSGSYPSSAIHRKTTYTLTCVNPGGQLVQTATVYHRPVFEEI